jgi:hypothetical protein
MNLLWDMADWFQEQGGDPVIVKSAIRVLKTPNQLSVNAYFRQLLGLLQKEGQLRFVRRGRASFSWLTG